MFKCDKCNSELEKNAKFCINCGARIEIQVEEKENSRKNNEENKSLEKSILKKIIYRIIAVIIAYVGFVALKVALVGQGISFGESTLVGASIFIGLYNISTGFLLKIKSSGNRGIWFILITIFLVFVSIKGEPERATSSAKDILTTLKNQIPKKLDKNTTLLKLDINGDNVAFEYYINNASIDNMTPESQNIFVYTVKKELCNAPLYIKVMEHNYNIDIKYLDKNYNTIGKVQLSKNECK